MFYIYILYSESSDLYYVGYTDDYNRRLKEHNSSERNTYSGKHRPWKLAAVFECGSNRGEAMKIENFIKKQKSRKLLDKMISGESLSGLLAQLVIPYVRDGRPGLIRGSSRERSDSESSRGSIKAIQNRVAFCIFTSMFYIYILFSERHKRS